MAKVPNYVHDANVAGLARPAAHGPFVRKPTSDNTPSIEWLANRFASLAGNEPEQTALFESLPLDIQDALWARWELN